MVPQKVPGKEDLLEKALEVWKELRLRDDFVAACERLPMEMCCCGLLSDQDGTKRRFVMLLNEGWCKRANKKLNKRKAGLKVDCFLWNWQNASGKSESNILLIRFIQTSSYRLNEAMEEGSVDFELLDKEDLDVEEFEEAAKTPDVPDAPEDNKMDR